MRFAIERESHPRIAQQQKNGQHRLLNQRRKLLMRQPQSLAVSQRTRQKKPDHSGNESQVRAEATVSWCD